MFSGKRKGFSVFTPLVGTLVILITFLIVAWMLESEKWNFNGLIETYQTIQAVGVNQEAQDRAIATIRDTILSDLEDNMKVNVPDCRNFSVLEKFSSFYGNSPGLGNWYDEVCENKSLSEVKKSALSSVTGLGLSSQYLMALITAITSKYSLIKISTNICSSCEVDTTSNPPTKTCLVYPSPNSYESVKEIFKWNSNTNTWDYSKCDGADKGKLLSNGLVCPAQACVDPTTAIERVELMDCDISNGLSSGIDWSGIDNDCKDGRIAVWANFSTLSDNPIATITSNASQYTELQIYLPKEEKSFITNDPIGYYILVLSHLFQNFTLLDSTWHKVGNVDDHGANTDLGYTDNGFGNGSHWYHYKYAVQYRVPPSTAWKKIGNVSGFFSWITNATSTLLASYDSNPVDLISQDGNENPFLGLASNCGNNWCNRNMRGDMSGQPDCSSSWDWGCFWKFFDIGVTNISETAELANISNSNPWKSHFKDASTYSDVTKDIFPGGTVEPDFSGSGNAFSHVKGFLSPFDISHFVSVDTITEYDKKFFSDPQNFINGPKEANLDKDQLAKATELIHNHLVSSDALKTSAGYAIGDSVVVNVSVDSYQYYLCNNSTGGNNWDCGQWMAQYIPYIVGKTNSTNGLQSRLGSNNYWFLSLPLNFSCYTCTLYRVEEHYNVTRNSHEYPNTVNKTVLRITFTRKKEDYSNPGGDQGLDLWVKGVNSTDVFGNNINLREVLYTCQAGPSGSEVKCQMRVLKDEATKYLNQSVGF